MMKISMKLSFALLLFLLVTLSLNASATGFVEVDKLIAASFKSTASILMSTALKWLVLFAGLQFVVTNIGLLKSGADIEAVFGKLMGSILWIGFCFYLINNAPDFIDKVGHQFVGLVGVDLPDKSTIFLLTIAPGLALLIGAVAVGGMGAVGSVVGGQIIMMLAFMLIGAGFYLVIKLFMITLEILIVVTLSPLSFAFLGLNALKDQGIAPLKSLISLGYRIILMTVVLGGFANLSVFNNVVSVGLHKLTSPSNLAQMVIPFADAYGVGDFVGDVVYGLFGYVVLIYLLFKSDSIAASLAGGSTNMGAGDVASAAAAGAAIGAAGASAAAPLTEKGKSMSEVIKGLGADAGSVSNASPTGAGGIDQKMVGTAPPSSPKAAELSMAQVSADRMERNPGGGKAAPTGGGVGSNNVSAGSSASPSKATQATNNTSDNISTPVQPLSAPASGSGESAGIGGSGSTTDQKLDKLIDSMSAPKPGPGFLDKLSTANDHIAKEQAATHVNISTHHSD